jgi:integrase
VFSCQSRNIFQASLGSMSFVAQSASAEPGRSRWMNLLVLRSGFRLLLFVLLPLRTLVHCGQPQEGRARHDRDTVFRGCCDRAALDHDEGRLRRLVQLMLESGMRPEEVYRIGQENVNLAAGFLANPYGRPRQPEAGATHVVCKERTRSAAERS